MEKVLLAEDEERMRNIIFDYFSANGLECDMARDGNEALAMLHENDYDAVLLDVLMPGADGFEVCREIRKSSGVPVLFLTALGSEEDTLNGYALGCDDYVAKPFSLAVLLAKTRALIRRRNGGSPLGILKCGAVKLDTARRTCFVGQNEVRLSPKEYDLLLCLMRNHGQALSREQLLNKVWGADFEGEDRAVDVRVRSLRSALGDAGRQIKTLPKVGYRFDESQF